MLHENRRATVVYAQLLGVQHNVKISINTICIGTMTVPASPKFSELYELKEELGK